MEEYLNKFHIKYFTARKDPLTEEELLHDLQCLKNVTDYIITYYTKNEDKYKSCYYESMANHIIEYINMKINNINCDLYNKKLDSEFKIEFDKNKDKYISKYTHGTSSNTI